MPATTVLPLRFPDVFIAELRTIADRQGDSLNGLVRRTLADSLGIADAPLPRGRAGALAVKMDKAKKSARKAKKFPRSKA